MMFRFADSRLASINWWLSIFVIDFRLSKIVHVYQKSIIKNRISIIVIYQKAIIKNRISIIDYRLDLSKIDYQIDCQRLFTCKSKINCKKSIIKNRSSKIDFILDAHAYHILPEFCRKRRSICLGQPALAGKRNSEWPYFRVSFVQ